LIQPGILETDKKLFAISLKNPIHLAMPNLNKVMLMGNLTRDPELRRTPKGTSVTDISLAVTRYFTQDDGVKREETTFVDITLWGRPAEVVCDYCGKGRPLYVEGRLTLDSWEDKASGQQRTKLKVIGENVQLLGSREGGAAGNSSPSAPQQGYNPGPQTAQSYQPQPQPQPQPSAQAYQPPPQPQTAPKTPPPDTNTDDDDIPF
jgi:single-strand DNA-binding protein